MLSFSFVSFDLDHGRFSRWLTAICEMENCHSCNPGLWRSGAKHGFAGTVLFLEAWQ